MSIFVDSTPAPAARTKNTTVVALFYALLLVAMAVAQLYGFEKFIPLIEQFGLPGGHGTAAFVAGFLVASEVLAVPFLLRMRLSPLMRVVSMVLGWLVATAWLKLSLWVVFTGVMVDTMGFLGTSVLLPAGLWAVFYSAALLVLAAWAGWGLWPIRTKR